MDHNTEISRRTGSFRVEDGRILLCRIGPASGQVQHHNRCARDMETGARREWNAEMGDYASYVRRTPVRRGIWTFPYPFQDAFFYSHVWRRHLPKAFREGSFDWEAASDAEREAHGAEHEAKLKEIRRLLRPRLIWHGGPFYSHVPPKGMVGERNWWRYERPRDFVEAARGRIWSWHPGYAGDGPWRCRYSVDHLEIFVPT